MYSAAVYPVSYNGNWYEVSYILFLNAQLIWLNNKEKYNKCWLILVHVATC